ncbi:hypothetical protein MSG28_014707 [Choristoneura fumiferana]|uniref:Uncharacterized protein n=1 Tax=Choristoneura fumiferana TaxID=7141 RepID=A0ACC0JSH5_CHOFU|nr:hypothetical protein MSG28_014707 [Choristoneura fumiferana]
MYNKDLYNDDKDNDDDDNDDGDNDNADDDDDDDCFFPASDKSCTTENKEEGECVPYYLCDGNNTIIEDGTGIIDIRVRDGPCQSYLDTCCVSKERRKPNDPITPPVNIDDSATSSSKGIFVAMADTKCHGQAREGCGWNNPDGVGTRITGGVDGEANFAEFPWMVAILKIEPVNAAEPDGQKLNVYVGGGSLIHPSVVLTAAHYVAGASALRVRAGEWDTQTKNELYPYQDRDVRQTVVHKDFNSGNLFYDVGLLFLSSPVEAAPNVGVACLPPLNMRVAPGTRCFASGWGKDVYGKEGRYQVILKRVELPVVDRTRCEQLLQSTRLGVHFRLHSSFMCAGGEPGRDTCRGDGGSPLVCPAEYDKDRYVQYGIVAWGIGCGDKTPGVYVDVAKLRSWIDDKVAGQGFDPNVYTLV